MTQIKLRRDTSANFASKNPILGNGEPAYETDTKKLKIGDGTTAYTQLEYFSAGGGGSTNISATLPLKIVDGVISLEVDGQTIQIVDGKLHANLDELGNEVNTLAGELTGVQADILNKQDKLTPKLPLKINVVPDERVFGFTINTQSNQMHADANQEQTMFFGFGQNGTIDTNKVHSYIKIPYSVGQLLELPYKPTQYSEDADYVNRTAMLAGWFGHTNENGTISPVATASMRSNWSGGSYDQQSTYLFTSFENNAGVYTKKNEIICGEELGFNTGSASRPTVFVQINSATNSFDIQFPSGGYLNPDYAKYWTAGTTGFVVSGYPTIDCFIYCPPKQESIDTNFFGLYNSETRLRNTMMQHAENSTNIFSFESVDTSYLQLDIGSGLAVVDGKLQANLDELGNEVNSLTGEVTDLTGRVSANEASISAMKTAKQDKLTAGTGIKIEKNVISNTQTSTEWGDIQGNITAQEDLQNTLNTKVDKVEGKSLILDTEIERLKGVHNYDDTQIKKDITNINSALKTKASTTDLQNGLKTKQDKLTFDTTPTANSSNPVTSGGIKTALDKKANSTTLTAELAKKQNTLVSGTNIKTINGQSVLGGGNITVGDSVPKNMVTTDTAQTITGSKTFNGTVTLKSAKIGNQISALQVPLYTENNTITLTPIVQSFTDLDNPVSELRFGSINNKLEVRGSEVVDKNNKKFLTQGNITGTGNITITETDDGVQISSTGELNNPYSLFDSKYSDHELNNLSWLKSEGQWDSKTVYSGAYDKLLKVHNGTETVEGLSVKLSTEEYTDYDFVLNTAEKTFRLPLLNGSEVLPSNTVIKTLGTTTINATETHTLFTASHNGFVSLKGLGSGESAGRTLIVLKSGHVVGCIGCNANSYDQGTVNFEVKRGDVVTVYLDQGSMTYNYEYLKAVGNGSLYYYVGETVQNANLIDAGRIGEQLVNIKASIDGDWIYKQLVFANSVSLPINTEGVGAVFTYDLSNYLPNDGYKYEVTISAEVNNSSFCTLGYYLPDNSWCCFAKGGNPIGGWFNAIVDSSRQVKLSVVNIQEALMWARAVAYRRLGKKV